MKKNNKLSLLAKNLFFLFVLLALVGGSFLYGVYFAKYSNSSLKNYIDEDALYLGDVIGKYQHFKDKKISKDVNFDIFWETWDELKKYYVDKDKITDKKLFYGALHGMVEAVGDPYTVFMDPKVSKEFADDMAGTFEGIGAEIGIKNDVLTIVAPLPDMPAEKAGLKAGDKVLAINGTSTMGISIDEAVNKIRGPKGTDVVLTIMRKDFEKPKDIKITRGSIVVKSVRTDLKDNGIFVITITNFNNDTSDLFKKAVDEAVEKKVKGIILDLRNNPGGYLETAIDVASAWVESGPIVSEKYSNDKIIEHLARGRAKLKNIPTVVLVNQGSASASEIVSGALQDYHLATIVGKKTFGKGSVQTLNDLEDGSSLKITVAKWLTPQMRSINEEGIEPDIEVDYTRENYEKDEDPQMDVAMDILEHPEKIKEYKEKQKKEKAKQNASGTPEILDQEK